MDVYLGLSSAIFVHRTHLKEHFAEMTPISKNTDVSLKDIGEFMQNYTKEHLVKDVPYRY